jgi:hypothetical protein
MESSGKRVALLLVSFCFMVAAFGTQKLRLDQKLTKAREVDLRAAETTYMPPNEVVRFLSMGYEPFASDMAFMAANNYFATHLSFDRKYEWLDTYVDSIIGYCRDRFGRKLLLPPDECEPRCKSDENCTEEGAVCDAGICQTDMERHWVDGVFPFNPRVFLWAAQVIKFAPILSNEIIDRSIYYGRTGIYFCPDNWELYFDVGFNLYFEYRDKTPEETRALRMKGLDYLSLASVLPNSSVDPNFVAGNLWDKEETERAIQQIYQTYYHASDRQREEIRTRARAYGEKELANRFEDEETRWQEQFGYIPQPLFHVVGPMVAVERAEKEQP